VDVRAVQLLMQTYAAPQDIKTGIARLKEIVGAHPDSGQLQQLLGQWYARAGNPDAARVAYEAAKASDPHSVTVDISLAELDIQLGRNDAAIRRLDPVVKANPRNVSALIMVARAQEAMSDHNVISTYRKILDVDPSNVAALNNLAYGLAIDNPDEALGFAQKALEAAPDTPYVQDTLGWIYYRKQLYSMAVRYLETAVSKEATPRRQFHLGMSYLKMGDQAKGQKIVREALLKDPNLAKTEQGW
jgi:predicted Zn-dependent protease